MTRFFRSFSGITTSRTKYIITITITITIIVIIVVVVVLLFIIYTINLSVVRPRSCRVIYYFDTLALGRRYQSFGRVMELSSKKV